MAEVSSKVSVETTIAFDEAETTQLIVTERVGADAASLKVGMDFCRETFQGPCQMKNPTDHTFTCDEVACRALFNTSKAASYMAKSLGIDVSYRQ